MVEQMKIGNRWFDIKNKTYIMGILNVTPDSFSDGGRFNEVDTALFRVKEMIAEGADIIDVGGESTRPGYTVISEQEEIERVVPVIEKIAAEFDVPVSIDTYKSRVADAALDAGAVMVNDIWALKKDPDMADIIAAKHAVCCLMHNRQNADYSDFVSDVVADLEESLKLAEKAGISRGNIIIDPGVGFAKSYEQNLQIINNVDNLVEMGYPVLLATSRKSVIGLTLDLPKDQRMEGTLATTVMGVMKGCSFVRVHDIKENKRAIQMTEAVLGR